MVKVDLRVRLSEGRYFLISALKDGTGSPGGGGCIPDLGSSIYKGTKAGNSRVFGDNDRRETWGHVCPAEDHILHPALDQYKRENWAGRGGEGQGEGKADTESTEPSSSSDYS